MYAQFVLQAFWAALSSTFIIQTWKLTYFCVFKLESPSDVDKPWKSPPGGYHSHLYRYPKFISSRKLLIIALVIEVCIALMG
jgi:hypothetical protein